MATSVENNEHWGQIPIAPRGSVLRKPKAAEVVARDIVRDILAQGLVPGDRLPLEAEMLDSYGVSRESLREGLRLLEVQGMISIRRGPGGGPTVGTVDPANMGRMQALFFHMAGATYDDLFEAWRFGEVALARLAAGNVDDEARAAVMRPYVEDDVGLDEHADIEVFVEGHGGFHASIADLAGNKVMALTLRSLGQIVAHHVATAGDPRRIHDVLVHDHVEIAKAIAEGDVGKSDRLMGEHLSHVVDLTRGELGEVLDGPVEWL